MFVIMSVVFTLMFSSYTASASSLEPLLRAAGISTMPKSTAAADFQLPDVAGKIHPLHAQRGKVVFLNFWASWCPPCVYEMPVMEQLHQTLRQAPFVVWAVNMQEAQTQVARFMTGNRLHFLALLDADGAVSARYQVQGLPTTYLIDCAGNIAGWVVGTREWTNEETRTLLLAMLNDSACR
jgi:thiol-disulfide isomerase/thioredoxin